MIYLDHAATTPLCQEAYEAMLPWIAEKYGNPSAIYEPGQTAGIAVSDSRREAAALVGAEADELFFTSGGTEADNWALQAAFDARRERGRHIITTAVEHPAVLRCCEYLERVRGAEVTYLQPDRDGYIDPSRAEAAIRPDTILISVMFANNETGTIQPVREIGRIAAGKGILFHSDAVQAAGHIPVDFRKDGIDLLSVSAHKLNGPKGVGCLCIRRGVRLPSLLHGGSQEHHRRAGTENVAGIVGFGAAARKAAACMESRRKYTEQLRDLLAEGLQEEISGLVINSPVSKRGKSEGTLPGHLNISIPGIESETLVILMDRAGICISAGSACSSGSLEPSHVLKAMGRSDAEARSTVRLTVGHDNTADEIRQAVKAVRDAVERLRRM